MNIEIVTRNEQIAVVQLNGALDIASAMEVKRRIAVLLGTGRNRLVIDLGKVSFIDSSGLAALVSALKACHQTGGQLLLAQPSSQAQYVVQLAGLDRVLPSHDSVEEALAFIDERFRESLVMSGDLSQLGRLRGGLTRLVLSAEKLVPGSGGVLRNSFETVVLEIAAEVLRSASHPGEPGALAVDLSVTPSEARAVIIDHGGLFDQSPTGPTMFSAFDAAARGLDAFEFRRKPREGNRWTLAQSLSRGRSSTTASATTTYQPVASAA